MHYSEIARDGKKPESDFRGTQIWELHGGKWLIVTCAHLGGGLLKRWWS